MNPSLFEKGFCGLVLLSGLAMVNGAAANETLDKLLKAYQAESGEAFSAERGKALWVSSHVDARSGKERACASCHTSDPRRKGKHIRTGKVIAPMAVSVNPKRFTDRRKVEKWFKRNCKWTLKRECTPLEKGDILSFLARR